MNRCTPLIRPYPLMTLALLALTGCSITQEISPLTKPVERVCIVENKAVKEGVLDALNEAFINHKASTRVIPGTYTVKHKMVQPTWQTADASACDALTFYTANWTWDLSMYMVFANVWMTPPDGSVKLAQATYDATGGGGRMDKFIDARVKLLELVNKMYEGTPQLAASARNAETPALSARASDQTRKAPLPSDAAASPLEERLRALKRMRDEGLVSAEEYERKHQELLKEL
jgi:hypothetical protein